MKTNLGFIKYKSKYFKNKTMFKLWYVSIHTLYIIQLWNC